MATTTPDLKRSLTSDSPQVVLNLNPRQAELINSYLASGLWGNSPNQVCLRLIDHALRATLNEKVP